MLATLAVIFPFFALVLGGYLAARTRLLPLDSVAGLNVFVLYFALPCMLWRFGSSTPLLQLFNPVTGTIWALAALAVVGGAVAYARRRGSGWPDAAMGALVAAFPNSGFMGVPLILALLGPQALGPVMVTLLVDLVLTTSLCIGLSQWGAGGEHGAVQAALRALRGVLRNPMPWSILLGALAGALGFSPWVPFGRVVQLLGDAASPVALFTIGAVLARSQFRTAAEPTAKRTASSVWAMSAAKLMLHPLLVWLLCLGAVRLGWLPAPALAPLVLTAALPAASNVSLLAERFGADNGRVARIILLTTALAFFSFSGAVALLR